MSSIFYLIFGFAIFFLIFWMGKWIVHILAICYGKYKLHKKVCNIPRETPLPSVSILKPLMGIDPNLSQNLETFFSMNYPIYELLFCIEDKNDPAVQIVQNLRERYPNIETSLFLGGSNVGVNPKINNMHPGYLAAKYELIMISDSGIKMKEDTLLDMVVNMTEKVGLVHQMPFTCDRDGFAATFEKIFFGTIQSRIYLCADLLGINCHTGMSCLLRKSVLDDLGGLSKFGCYLAEDFFLAKSLIEKGWKMKISSQPAWQNSGTCEIKSFQARLCRWAKLRVAMIPTTILLEPLSECLIVGAFASWSVGLLFGWDPLVFYLIHILMWFLSDWILLSIVQNGTLTFNKFEYVVGWAFREMSGPYLFLHALYDPAIRWRTRLYKLQWGGKAYELPRKNIDERFSNEVPNFGNSFKSVEKTIEQNKLSGLTKNQAEQNQLFQQTIFDQTKIQNHVLKYQKPFEVCEKIEHKCNLISVKTLKLFQLTDEMKMYKDFKTSQSDSFVPKFCLNSKKCDHNSYCIEENTTGNGNTIELRKEYIHNKININSSINVDENLKITNTYIHKAENKLNLCDRREGNCTNNKNNNIQCNNMDESLSKFAGKNLNSQRILPSQPYESNHLGDYKFILNNKTFKTNHITKHFNNQNLEVIKQWNINSYDKTISVDRYSINNNIKIKNQNINNNNKNDNIINNSNNKNRNNNSDSKTNHKNPNFNKIHNQAVVPSLTEKIETFLIYPNTKENS